MGSPPRRRGQGEGCPEKRPESPLTTPQVRAAGRRHSPPRLLIGAAGSPPPGRRGAGGWASLRCP